MPLMYPTGARPRSGQRCLAQADDAAMSAMRLLTWDTAGRGLAPVTKSRISKSAIADASFNVIYLLSSSIQSGGRESHLLLKRLCAPSSCSFFQSASVLCEPECGANE